MGFFSSFKRDLQLAKRERAAQINGKQLKGLLKKFKEERDQIESNAASDTVGKGKVKKNSRKNMNKLR